MLSLLAVVLICGAPALISVISEDNTYVHQVAQPWSTIDDEESKAFYGRYDYTGAPTSATTVVRPSLNSGTAVLMINDVSDAVNVRYIGYAFSAAAELEGISSITIRLSSAPTQVQLHSIVSTDYRDITTATRIETEGPGSLWEVDIPPAVQAKYNGGMYTQHHLSISYAEGGSPVSTEIAIVPYTSWELDTSSIVVGFTGAILIFCAILATPYFGIRKRRA